MFSHDSTISSNRAYVGLGPSPPSKSDIKAVPTVSGDAAATTPRSFLGAFSSRDAVLKVAAGHPSPFSTPLIVRKSSLRRPTSSSVASTDGAAGSTPVGLTVTATTSPVIDASPSNASSMPDVYSAIITPRQGQKRPRSPEQITSTAAPVGPAATPNALPQRSRRRVQPSQSNANLDGSVVSMTAAVSLSSSPHMCVPSPPASSSTPTPMLSSGVTHSSSSSSSSSPSSLPLSTDSMPLSLFSSQHTPSPSITMSQTLPVPESVRKWATDSLSAPRVPSSLRSLSSSSLSFSSTFSSAISPSPASSLSSSSTSLSAAPSSAAPSSTAASSAPPSSAAAPAPPPTPFVTPRARIRTRPYNDQSASLTPASTPNLSQQQQQQQQQQQRQSVRKQSHDTMHQREEHPEASFSPASNHSPHHPFQAATLAAAPASVAGSVTRHRSAFVAAPSSSATTSPATTRSSDKSTAASAFVAENTLAHNHPHSRPHTHHHSSPLTPSSSLASRTHASSHQRPHGAQGPVRFSSLRSLPPPKLPQLHASGGVVLAVYKTD